MKNQKGFSLIEMAIVLVVIGILASTILLPLGEQMESARRSEAEIRIGEIKEALLGFAIANGRLPCPATLASNGREAPTGGGNCTQQHGFIPYETLGISGNLNQDNMLDDPWGNPFGYSISVRDVNSNGLNDYTTSGELQTIIDDARLLDGSSQQLGIHALTVTFSEATGWPSNPCTGAGNTNCNDLQVFNQSSGTMVAYTTTTPVVIYSLGANWAKYNIGGTGLPSADEAENVGANINGSRVYRIANNSTFIKNPTSSKAGSEYDDVVDWISKNTLISKLLAAGQISPP